MDFQSIINRQERALSLAFEKLETANKKLGILPWYEHVPPSRGIPKSVSESLLISRSFETLKFDDTFLDLLSLHSLSQLGTWGRFKIIVDERFENVLPEKNAYIFILHCNIHNEPSRIQSINSIFSKMKPRLKDVGIDDVMVISTNQNPMPEDIIYASKVHKSFAHWYPYSTAFLMKKYFSQYPKSYVITSNYIGSLLLDNHLYFRMNFRFHPDVVASIAFAFEDIYRHSRRSKGASREIR